MASDVAWTTAATLVLLVGNIALSYMLARRGAVAVYGPYNLARRLGAAAMPVVVLGLNLGVAKFVAGCRDAAGRRVYEIVASALTAVMIAAVTAIVVVAPRSVSMALLGTVDVTLTWAMWCYVVGMSLNALLYSVYRGEFRQGRANVSNLVAGVGLPVLVLALAPRSWSASALLFGSAALASVWCVAGLAAVLVRRVPERGRASYGGGTRELLAYSVPRVPGLLAAGAIMAVGPFVAQRGGAPLIASYLLAGMSLVQIGNVALSGFNIVLLPRVAEMHAQSRTDEIRTVTGRVLFLIACVSAFAVPLLWAVCGDLIRVWLGPAFVPGVPIARVLLLSVPALVAFAVLTSVTDASIERPVSTYAGVVGLVVTAIVSVAAAPSAGVTLAYAFVAGEWVAGAWIVVVLVARTRPVFPVVYTLAMTLAAVALAAGLTAAGPSAGGSSLAALGRVTLACVLVAVGVVAALWWSPRELGLRPELERMARWHRA